MIQVTVAEGRVVRDERNQAMPTDAPFAVNETSMFIRRLLRDGDLVAVETTDASTDATSAAAVTAATPATAAASTTGTAATASTTATVPASPASAPAAASASGASSGKGASS